MASTGLPGMRRGRRKFSSRATTKTTRVQATFRPMYLASAMFAAFAPLRQTDRDLCADLLDLEQPLDARAAPHRGSVWVLFGREVLPVARIELIEAQRAVHQRYYRNVLAIDLVEGGVRSLGLGIGLGTCGSVQMRRNLGVLEPAIIPERGLATVRYPSIVQCITEADPGAGRADPGVAVHAAVEVAVLHPCEHRRELREFGADVDPDFLDRLRDNLAGGVPVGPTGGGDQLPRPELGAIRQLVDAV